jgi:hypothetical protein
MKTATITIFVILISFSLVFAQSNERVFVKNTDMIEFPSNQKSASIQSDFYEDFSNPHPGWVTYDEDGDGENWAVIAQIGESILPFTGSAMAASFSWNGSPLTPDNWLVSPPINLGNNGELSFYVNSNDGWPDERLTVYVSMGSNSVGDFTEEVFDKVLAAGEWRQHVVDLSEFAGQNIYIGFRHWDSFDFNYLILDAVSVTSEGAEVGPFSNLTPSDGTVITVDEDDATSYNITWEPAEGASTYAWFAIPAGGDFSAPALNIDSNAFGMQPTLTLTGAQIYEALIGLEFEHGQTVELEWTGAAIAPGTTKLAEQSFALTVNLGEATNIENENNPFSFELAQNYPNPFNPTTNISFTLPQSSDVTLEVFNMQGQRVATLVNSTLGAGSHTVPFNAENLSSGIYLYRMTAGAFSQTNKMMLVK